MQNPIYLDYLATTPVDPRVADAMAGCLTLDGNFGNPASRSHLYGWRAEQAVEQARCELAELLNADPREIVWTSGATEADNLAIKGVIGFNRERGRHIVTSQIEHKAVLDTCAWLEQQGCEVTRLSPGSDGLISADSVAAALRPDTVLVSIMQVNNELGTVNDIAAIGAVTRAAGVLLHVDAAQSVGKMAVDLAQLPVDLLSISAHKFYGPKGIGALYVRRQPRVGLEAQIHGGGHERGMRSGTLPTHQIVGLGTAATIARAELAGESVRLLHLREQLWQGIADIEGVTLNG
ncbi:MAG TPA: aminotransferase class V-fold PLP-dependent enzyme, partial [Kineobactrum sp.]